MAKTTITTTSKEARPLAHLWMSMRNTKPWTALHFGDAVEDT